MEALIVGVVVLNAALLAGAQTSGGGAGRPVGLSGGRDRGRGGDEGAARVWFWVRRRSSLPLAVVLLWAGLVADAAAQGSAATDRVALEALYDATGGADWTNNTDWKTSASLDDWFGVTTNAAGRVEGLNLSGNGLTGSLPPALGDLVQLRWLLVDRNALTGAIPSELSSLVNLVNLNLSRNAFDSGPVPAWLGSLTELIWLRLTDTSRTGVIPSELGSLVNLERLYLDRNDLTGPIPSELGSLVNLERLSLSRNALTGAIPSELGSLVNLEQLYLYRNDLTGAIPSELGSLVNLEGLYLYRNDLTGPIPSELGSLTSLKDLWLFYNWGLTGRLPAGLQSSPLERLDIFVTQTCAPDGWREWLGTIDGFSGRLCGVGPDVTIDVAVVYTPAARDAAGGIAAIEADIDLMVASANRAFEASGVHHRLALVERFEVSYTETGDSILDLTRLAEPSDGHLDAVHEMRDRVGADLVHLVVGDSDAYGRAILSDAFSLSQRCCLAHELGHNMGLEHDRYQVHHNEGGARAHPAYGYVNQRAFESGASESSCWVTIMAYGTQCNDADLAVSSSGRFSNPRQEYRGDPLGVPYAGTGESGITGPADAAAVLHATGPAVALWRDRPAGPNRPPAAAGTLPDRYLTLRGTLTVDVSQAFVDPDGDPLTYGVSSSAPHVATVLASGTRVALTAVGEGTAVVQVTATDPGGLSATQSFMVTVGPGPNGPPEAVGVLPPLTLGVDDAAVTVEVGGAFRDPDGDALTYGAGSSAPGVASVSVFGSRVTVTPVAEGAATVTVTATDTGGSNTTAFQTFTVTVSSSSVPSDRAALEALYDATGGAGWKNRTNWKTSVPLGEWFGVTTNAAGRVTQLDLKENGLAGPIPAALQGLASLEQLYLWGNELTGPIPTWLGHMTRLRFLNLGGNALTGPIPGSLASLANLEQLYLWGNQLTGPVPAWLGNMTRLRWLSLGNNAFSTGPIPGSLASLVNLEVLYLYENNLTGPIPVWLGNLVQLEWLALSDNSLSGDIPRELTNLRKLKLLYLSGNRLTGPIPPGLAGLANLEMLGLQENGLTGRIPAWLGGLTNLRSLTLGGSGLTGPIPRELSKLINLETLYLWGLGLTGPIPAWLGGLGNLSLLSLSRNRLTGAIPPELGSLARLQRLWLYGNPLTGTVPESLTRLSLAVFWIHETGVCVPADAAFQAWVATIGNFRGDICTSPANRPPEPVGSLPPLTIRVDERPVMVEISGAFRDPDGDRLTYGASSSLPSVASVSVSGSRVTVVPVSAGAATVTVTATDTAGSNTAAVQRITVTVIESCTNDLGVVSGRLMRTGSWTGDCASAHFFDKYARYYSFTLLRRSTVRFDLTSSVDTLLALRSGSGTGGGLIEQNDDVGADNLNSRIETTLAAGRYTIEATTYSPFATGSFTLTLSVARAFTDHPIVAGVTQIKAVHFTELRMRINRLRATAGLGPYAWTDPVLAAGSTRVRLMHLTEMRLALAPVFAARGRQPPFWTDAAPTAGRTPIRAAHLMELRAAVVALE